MSDLVSVLDGNTFVVSDRRGDITSTPTDPSGLFENDTRFLSRWVLTVNGQRPALLSTDDVEYFAARFFLAPSSGTIYVDAALSVIRERRARGGFDETIQVINHGHEHKKIALRIEVDADFADLFEVKDAEKKKGDRYRRVDGDELVLGYIRDTWRREPRVRAPGATMEDGALAFELELAPRGERRLEISVRAAYLVGERPSAIFKTRGRPAARAARELIAAAPELRTDDRDLLATYERSVVDLDALRFYPMLTPGGAIPAAGLPWFMAPFGRDSVITSLQTLPFVPELARPRSATSRCGKVPRATCEIQGYVYDAKMRCARLARALWKDHELAMRLESEAADLKRRFNRDYWIESRECFALALGGDGLQVDSITSNIGHLLWSGIVADDKIDAVVAHLGSDALFSGWGIRTMASTEGAYNPIGYHVGTVWPFDNSLIALGLNRAGARELSTKIASAVLETARYFRYRLPEAYAGYARAETEFPVEYPTACSPQAWSTGAPLLFLRAMLGLEPRGDRLTVDACLPPSMEHLEILGVRGRWGETDVAARRSKRR